ncbi:hypothetical protein ZIOFF_073845 [Zingiber officinale]|uniref:Uncharacterized protein n=1 Tax=Zingiber officinale TaxID=94328 RepID=A0A8J5C6J3_ZINOF|nr:hypothetical protein ZIOFF_073845 [Zingiber officinale]
METDERHGDFRLRSVLGLSHSSHGLLESSVSADCDRLTNYERLPHSVSRLDESPRRQPLFGLCCFLAHSLARKFPAAAGKKAGRIVRRTAPEDSDRGGKRKEKEKRKRRWSSWLPDPDRRWPVQGF